MDIIKEDEFSRTIRLHDGQIVVMSTDDRYDEVNVEALFGRDRVKVGRFEFDQPEDCPYDCYRLSYMVLDGDGGRFRRKGIGRAILQFFIARTESRLICEPPGGPANDFGTQVCDEGIPFVQRMKEEGLIWFSEDEPEDEYFDTDE